MKRKTKKYRWPCSYVSCPIHGCIIGPHNLSCHLAMKHRFHPVWVQSAPLGSKANLLDHNTEHNRTILVSARPAELKESLDQTGARKEANEGMDSPELRWQMLAEATSEGVIIIQDRVVVEANQQFAEMFGYGVSEVLGTEVSTVAAEDSRELVVRNAELPRRRREPISQPSGRARRCR